MSWSDLAKLAAIDVLTGGAVSLTTTTLATTPGVAETAGAAAAANAGGDKGSAGNPNASRTPAPSALPVQSGRFEISGQFLLDSSTGRVWEFDAGKHVFNEVPKKVSPLNYWLIERNVEEMLEKAFTAAGDEALANIPEALRAEMKKKYNDQYIKPVRQELLKLKPA